LRADLQPGTVQPWWSRASTWRRSRGVTVDVTRAGSFASSEPISSASHRARSSTSALTSISRPAPFCQPRRHDSHTVNAI